MSSHVDSDSVQQFAAEAIRFREWVFSSKGSGPTAARETLVRITRLYLAGLALPRPWSDELDSGSAAEPPGAKRFEEIYRLVAARLPLQYYGEVFNPLPIPPEASIVGDLADDIADIFGDVDGGLRHYEAGQRAEAVWEWADNFIHHWGDHATSAIRALHCYMAAECPDQLTGQSK